ncbi:MAG: YlbF family regulator [Oscillospiraceae bacterium]|jgi:cell fate (sporulation/competence/biofilm development) regulator YlbF (YheA/YmcA/DUF963 family)|nr:YlbF family regulator [Oscillospiraceae bacterium]
MDDDIIEATRKIGELIQKDKRYKRFVEACLKNESDENLQNLFKQFHDLKTNDSCCSDEKNLKNDDFSQKTTTVSLYDKIMSNENMIEYKQAQEELSTLVSRLTAIIVSCAEGENPKTADLKESSGCSSKDCSCCSGCH